MASIDERVVAMSFENAKFEAGVAQSLGTLAKLNDALKKIGGDATGFSKIEAESHKVTMAAPMTAIEKLKAKLSGISVGGAFAELESASHKVSFSGIIDAVEKVSSKLHFPEAKTAFAELEAADDKVTFSDVNSAIDKTSSRFSILEGAAAVAFGNIATRASMGAAKAVTSVLGAIKDGFSDYELKIGATQTIMAGTGEDIGKVTGALKDLDVYADRTIYNLRDMTGNIGKFTNAGVKLPLAVDAMKGIANEAALSGASAEEAARSMYNLGQAIGSGVVRLQDWRSVDLANMGTKEFKEQLIDAALALGTLKKGSDGSVRSLKGNVVNFKTFNSTLQDQWLTSEALTKTLHKYSDENTALGKKAYAAASQVKTVTMMIQTLAAAAGTGWTDTFDIIIGNLPEATKLWTSLTNTIGGFISRSTDARNSVLKTWKSLGGRDDIIQGFKNAFEAVMRVLRSIGSAFREIFPRKTGEDLARMSENFKEFTASLIPSVPTMQKLHNIFEGFFALLHIGWSIIKQVGGVLADLFGVVGSGSGGFLNIASGLGNWLVAVDKAITQGGLLNGIFDSLSAVLQAPLEILKELASALASMFTGDAPAKADGVATAMDKLNTALLPLRGIMDDVQKGWESFLGILGKIRAMVEPGFTKVLDFLGNFGQMVADKFNNIDWDRALAALQTGLIGGLFLKVKSGLEGMFKIDVGGGVMKNLNAGLGALTTNLKAMQRGIQVATLLEIAGAILLLAGGVLILSQIPADKLEKAMSAVAVGLAQLVGAMALLSKVMGSGKLGFVQMPLIAGSLVLLAGAVLVLSFAMRSMAKLDWEGLAKGLVGVGGVLAVIAGATQLLNGPRLMAAGLAMIPLAIGLNLIAVAVKIFASMDPKQLGLGLLGLALSLDAIVAAMMFMPPNLPLTATGVLILSAALVILSGAIGAFGSMNLKTLVQGLLGISAALIGIGFAIQAIPPTAALQAAALVILAGALVGIAGAVKLFGSMSIGEIAKGLITMALALDVLAISLTAMSGTLGGSAALLLAAAALAILGPAIAFMGQLKWSTIGKGLLVMAISLTLLAVAGALAAGPITALGIALAALGGGMLVISAALSLFVIALAQLGDHGPKAIAAATAAFAAFLLVLPKLIIDFLKGLVVIVAEIVKIAPAIAESLVKIAGTLLDAIVKLAPKIAEAIAALVVLIAQVLSENVPKLAAAGLEMVVGLLTAIRDNMPKVMALATEIVVKFLEGLKQSAPRISKAGAETLVAFLSGINTHLGKVIEGVGKIVVTFLNAVATQIPKIAKSGVHLVVTFLAQIAKAVPQFITAGVNIILAFMDGVGNAIPRLIKKGLWVAKKFLEGVSDGLVGLAKIGFHAIINFINGLAETIRNNEDDLLDAGANLADAIIDGLVDGFGRLGGVLRTAIEKVFDLLPHWAKKILGISSPSKVFMEIGEYTMLGFIEGVKASGPAMEKAIEQGADHVVKTATSAFSDVPDLLEGIMDMEPVITPVLDLSNVERDAKKIGELADVVPISAAASFDQASQISVPTAAETDQAAQAGPSFEFNQYNTSPESLSEIEIYRQTNNQLGKVKTALGLAT